MRIPFLLLTFLFVKPGTDAFIINLNALVLAFLISFKPYSGLLVYKKLPTKQVINESSEGY